LLRVLGVAAAVSGVVQALKKPDGNPINPFSQPTNLPSGNIITDTGFDYPEKVSKATVNPGNLSASNTNLPGIPNALEQFASYTTLFTLAVLTKEQYNNPFKYRSGDFEDNQVVFSSAGRFDDTKRANTKYGTPEYYVDNLKINTVIAPNEGTGTSNAISLSFDIYEPYSVGLFLQTLAVAANRAGFPNYLKAVFCLKIEFLGFTDNGQLFNGVQPKYFLLQLRKANMSVTEAGSNYAVEAVPFNHQGFSGIVNTLINDVSLVGSTVQELLATGPRSLQQALNDRENEYISAKQKKIPDRYEIHFPPTSDSPIPGIEPGGSVNRATVNKTNQRIVASSAANANNDANFQQNNIGSSGFGFKIDSGGNYVAPTAGATVDEATGKIVRDKLTIDPKRRTFHYAQSQSIIAVISQAIMSSEYAFKVLTEKPDKNGRYNWFRIDVQAQLLDFDSLTGDYAKRYIFRVMPYKVHSSVFTNPNAIPQGYDNLEKEIVKTYSYIYTGLNNDVLKLDVNLNMAFYDATVPSPPQKAGRADNPDVSSSGEPDKTAPSGQEGNAGLEAQFSRTGSNSTKPDPKAGALLSGGSGNLTSEEIVANNFQKAFLDNGHANMINVDLEILGDPYWLVDNGIGGYIPGPGQTEMITEDGTANYEAGDIYIYIRWRSPIEPKESAGDYLFIEEKVSPFSGIYKVIKCENVFSSGVYKQTLNCVRMPRQAPDFDQKVTPSTSNLSLYDFTRPAKPATSILDEDNYDL
jgi:hypothetical protein